MTKSKKNSKNKPKRNKETNKNSRPKKKAKNSKISAKEINDRPKAKTITKIAVFFVWTVIVLTLIVGIFGMHEAHKMLKDKPELKLETLESPNSSIIYDVNGDTIVELGLYLRENIEYDEMPNCLVDAFLAVEDSRYFSHFGFDIPRFTQAIIVNIKNKDFSQGGSTITMQLIKNSYFQVDAGSNSTIADRQGTSGIKRKVQEIVLAIEADRNYSKQELFALFLNKVNFGNNIRGVQKAAQYYFGKDASELNLSESAFLAGIINSPNNNNPYNDLYKNSGNTYLNPDFNYLENATKRRNEVLDLMHLHGYINDEELALAKTVAIENLLNGTSGKFAETDNYYQSYIDAVIEEVNDKTGQDPYSTPMEIYTNMDPHMQKYIYDIQSENTEIKFRHENSQSAIVLMNNQTGELVALSGGRGQNEARMFNRAVDSRIQPGSTIKPIFEYALAFDKLGWATSYTITDRPIYLYNGHNLVHNAGGQGYYGDMLITEAIARSLNTPAVQTLMAVIDETSENECVDYLRSIGFDVEYEDFDLQFAIGGNKLTVSPVQLGAAHGMLMNKGYYIEPHTINKIVFADGEEYVADTIGKRVISEAAAYLSAYCEEYDVSGPFFNYMQILRSDYPVYAKTGTTDWGTSGRSYGIPTGAPKDSWLVCQTNKYTITIWLGFDSMGQGTYFNSSDDRANLKGRIGKMLLDECNDYYDYNPDYIERPDDVVEITHIKGVYPYCYPTTGTPVTGLIKKEFYQLNDISTIEKTTQTGTLTGMGATIDESGNLTISWYGFGSLGDGTKDLSATNIFGETTHAVGRSFFDFSNYIYPSAFYADIFVNGDQVNSITSSSPTYNTYVYSNGENVTVCGYTSSDSTQMCTDASRP